MKIEFDPNKDEANQKKHGVSLRLAEALEWESAIAWEDDRQNYGEVRMSALGLIGTRVYFVAFALLGTTRRIISLRKANDREVKRYVFEN